MDQNSMQMDEHQQFRPQQTCGLAVASLVLGIVGVCFVFSCFCFAVPLLGIPAVACGHIAIGQIKRAGGALTGRGLAIGGLVTGYCAIAVGAVMVAFMAVGVVLGFQEHAREEACMEQLKQISSAVSQYADEHDGQLPPDLQALLDVGDIEPGTFICPSDETYSEEDSGGWHSSYDSVFDLTDKILTVDSLPADVMFLWDNEARHTDRRNAALFGGDFDSLSEDEFEKQLKRLEATVDELE